MPTYDMVCTECQHIFEIRRSMKEVSPIPCAQCGGTTRHRISTMTTFTRNIDHPDSPLDDLPNAEKMRKQADWSIRRALDKMNK